MIVSRLVSAKDLIKIKTRKLYIRRLFLNLTCFLLPFNYLGVLLIIEFFRLCLTLNDRLPAAAVMRVKPRIGTRLFGIQLMNPVAPATPIISNYVRSSSGDTFQNPITEKKKKKKTKKQKKWRAQTLHSAVRDIPTDVLIKLIRQHPSYVDELSGNLIPYCPQNFHLDTNGRCIKKILRQPIKRCPLGTYKRTDEQCIHIDTITPEYVCPALFKAFAKGCIRQHRILPTLTCPKNQYLFGSYCIEDSNIPAEPECLSHFTFNKATGLCQSTEIRQPERLCSYGMLLTWPMFKNILKHINVDVSPMIQNIFSSIQEISNYSKYICVTQNELSDRFACPKRSYCHIVKIPFSLLGSYSHFNLSTLHKNDVPSTTPGIHYVSVNNGTLVLKQMTDFDSFNATVPEFLPSMLPFHHKHTRFDEFLHRLNQHSYKKHNKKFNRHYLLHTSMKYPPELLYLTIRFCGPLQLYNRIQQHIQTRSFFFLPKYNYKQSSHVYPFFDNHPNKSYGLYDLCISTIGKSFTHSKGYTFNLMESTVGCPNGFHSVPDLKRRVPMCHGLVSAHPTQRCPNPTHIPTVDGVCKMTVAHPVTKTCPKGYEVKDSRRVFKHTLQGTHQEQFKEYADFQQLCPLQYKIERIHGGIICTLEKVVPSSLMCDSGFIPVIIENGTALCEQIMEASPTLISSVMQQHNTSFPPGASVCTLTNTDALRCMQQRLYYGIISRLTSR